MTTITSSILAFTTANVLMPSITVRHEVINPVWIEIENTARCHPVKVTRWNPVNSWWRVETGFIVDKMQFSIGHVSEHGVDRQDTFQESFDFLKAQYTLKF